MKVTSREIRQQSFALRFRGYDPAAVDTFLELVAGTLEDLVKENAQLLETLAGKDQELQRIQEEGDWKKPLMAVQQTTADLIRRGEQQAQAVLAEAHGKAQAMLSDARKHLEGIEHDVQALTQQRRQFVRELRDLLDQHRTLLDAQEGEREEQRCAAVPSPLGEAAVASHGKGWIQHAAAGTRDPRQKRARRKARRRSATALKRGNAP